jgi:hypothetical protein
MESTKNTADYLGLEDVTQKLEVIPLPKDQYEHAQAILTYGSNLVLARELFENDKTHHAINFLMWLNVIKSGIGGPWAFIKSKDSMEWSFTMSDEHREEANDLLNELIRGDNRIKDFASWLIEDRIPTAEEIYSKVIKLMFNYSDADHIISDTDRIIRVLSLSRHAEQLRLYEYEWLRPILDLCLEKALMHKAKETMDNSADNSALCISIIKDMQKNVERDHRYLMESDNPGDHIKKRKLFVYYFNMEKN